MNDVPSDAFIETLAYYRFREFCDECRTKQYIGLCYGPPGVGKTLSGLHYANTSFFEISKELESGRLPMANILSKNVAFYTIKVVNSPGQIRDDIQRLRQTLHYRILEQIRVERDKLIADIREQEARQSRQFDQLEKPVADPKSFVKTYPTIEEVASLCTRNNQRTTDPTALLFIDEVDRLKPNGLDQIREIFDNGRLGIILIGMPGIEKRLARYPQLYSRIGFVHQFDALTAMDFESLFYKGWRPFGVSLPIEALDDEEGKVSILRVTGGNFRLLHRLLGQIQRILEINGLETVTRDVVETARESLVIGTV